MENILILNLAQKREKILNTLRWRQLLTKTGHAIGNTLGGCFQLFFGTNEIDELIQKNRTQALRYQIYR